MSACDLPFEEGEMLCESEDKSIKRFDEIMGTIEEIIMSDTFQELQYNFMEKYYKEFDDTEENKFVYTDIFKEYSGIVENCLESELVRRIPDFSMPKFSKSLQAHKKEITDDIFDMFLTFTDFMAFKEMFVDYRADKEGKNIDLMQDFVVHSLIPNPTL